MRWVSPWLASRGRPPWASPPSLDLRAIVAMGQHSRLIGCGGDLPWDLPEDRRYFLRLTKGHVLIVGRKTYEETGGALPGRRSLVVSSTLPPGSLPDAEVVQSVPEALTRARQLSQEAAERQQRPGGLITWVAGGESVYRECFEQAPLLYLTLVHEQHHCQEDGGPPPPAAPPQSPQQARAGGGQEEECAFFPEEWAARYPLLLASWPGSSSSSSRDHRPCTFTIWAHGESNSGRS